MQRNVSGQKWRVFAFDAATGLPVTGDAANITAKISLDFASAAGVTDTNPTETEDGYYLFDLTAAETNARDLAIYPDSSTSGVVVVGVPGNFQTEIGPQTTVTVTSEAYATVYLTTDEAGTTRAEGMSGDYRTDSNGVLTIDIEPGIYWVWVAKVNYTYTNPTQVVVGTTAVSVTIEGEADESEDALTFAELFGVTLPAEADVRLGVEYGVPGTLDLVGTLEILTAATGTSLSLWAGSDWTQAVTVSIPSTWDELYWTVKDGKQVDENSDSAAIIQIKLTNGGDASDGIQKINGAAATSEQKAWGSLAINSGRTVATITLTNEATGSVAWTKKLLAHDFAVHTSAGGKPHIVSPGTLAIQHNVTKTLP